MTRAPEATPAHSSWRRWLAWMPGLLIFLALITVVTHLSEAERLVALARRARPAWLLAAALLQAATYFSAAAVWQRVLRRTGAYQPLPALAPLAVARLFLDQVDVPADHWAAPWIELLAANGITIGCGNGRYCPDRPATRAEMAVFLTRAFNLPMP